jgi:hypothetical protein
MIRQVSTALGTGCSFFVAWIGVGLAPAKAEQPFKLEPPEVYRAQLEAMLAEGQPSEGANAWDELFTAIDAMKTVREWSAEAWDPETPLSQEPGTSVDEIRFNPFVLENHAPGLEYLRRVEAAGAWAALDRARDAPRRIAPFVWELDNDIGNVSDIQRRLSHGRMWLPIAGLAQMRIAHTRTDEAAIGAMVERMVTLSSLYASHPDGTVSMGAGAIALVCGEICHQLGETPWSDQLLARVDAELARIDPLPSPRAWLEAMPVIERHTAATDPESFAAMVEDTPAYLAAVDAAVAVALEQLHTPVAERKRPGAGYMERLAATMLATKHMGDDLEGRMALIPSAERAIGFIETTLDMDAQARATIAGTRAAIAAERYRHARGGLPDALERVVPEFLAAIPTDPMTGGPIGYRRTEKDPHGRGYLVYSVGPYGIDNKGRWPEEEPMFGMMALERGYDFVINRPRRTLNQ